MGFSRAHLQKFLLFVSLLIFLPMDVGCGLNSHKSEKKAGAVVAWHADYVQKQKQKTGFSVSSRALSRTEDQEWVYAHPLGNHDFNSIIGDNSKGLIKELSEMPHPPYVKAKDLTVQLAASVGNRAEQGTLIKKSYMRFVVFFETALDRDTFRNVSWDTAMEGFPKNFIQDYSEVIGYPLLGAYDAFPEIVDEDRIVITLKFVVMPASTVGGASAAGTKPVQFECPVMITRKRNNS